jgi:FkbM family methyltransferase
LYYLTDYLKHGDLLSVISSVKYISNKTSHRSDRIIKTSVGKFFCRKKTNDFQFANFYYEWNVKKYILTQLNSFSVFIDVGACVGEYCILLARKSKKCFAFEPVPSNLNALTRNIELNNLQNKVHIFPFGLGATNYKTYFIFNPVNTGATKMTSEKLKNTDIAEIKKFDDFSQELNIKKNEKILIKFDIEGMEVEAIQGATEFIRFFPNIFLIIEDKHSGEENVLKTLKKIAVFEVARIDNYNLTAKKIRNI